MKQMTIEQILDTGNTIKLSDAFDFAEFMWANIKGPNCINGYYKNQVGENKTVEDFWVSFQPFLKNKKQKSVQ